MTITMSPLLYNEVYECSLSKSGMDPTEHKCVDFIEIRRIPQIKCRALDVPVQSEHGVNTSARLGACVTGPLSPLKALSELNTLHIYVHQALVDFSCSCCLCSGVWGAARWPDAEEQFSVGLLSFSRLVDRGPATILLQGLSRISAQWTAWSRHSCLPQSRDDRTYCTSWRIWAPRLWCKPTSWALGDRGGAWAASTLQTITFSGSELAGLGLLLAPRKWHKLTCRDKILAPLVINTLLSEIPFSTLNTVECQTLLRSWFLKTSLYKLKKLVYYCDASNSSILLIFPFDFDNLGGEWGQQQISIFYAVI